MNDSLTAYRFDEAANSIYDFFWGEFCDWYLELIKPRLQREERLAGREYLIAELRKHHERAADLLSQLGEDTFAKLNKLEENELASLRRVAGEPRPTPKITDAQINNFEKQAKAANVADWKESDLAARNLVSMFEASLRLLHPVMPFITDELWHAIYDGKPPQKSLALAAYPQADQKHIDRSAEKQMAILQDLIVSVRNLRAELKIEVKLKTPIEVFSAELEIRRLIEDNRSAIERLANVDEIRSSETSLEKLPNVRHTARFDVRLIYEMEIDVAAEREKLTKELEKLEKELANGEKQLADEGFTSKAPAKIVEQRRARVEELKVLIAKLRKKLDELN